MRCGHIPFPEGKMSKCGIRNYFSTKLFHIIARRNAISKINIWHIQVYQVLDFLEQE